MPDEQLRTTMIERLQRIATFLARFQLLIFAMAGFSLLVMLLSVLENPWLHGDKWLIPSILGFCWALVLHSISKLFIVVPSIPGRGTGFRARTSIRLKLALLWVLGVFILGSGAALLILSYQLLRTWL